MNKFFVLFISLIILPVSTNGAGSVVDLKPVQIDLSNTSSLQRGAKIYINNCLGCHTLKYQRYVKLVEHLDLDKDTVEKNLIFTTEKSGEKTKIGSLMLNAVNVSHSKEAFGVVPPDLTLIARSRGSDWLYTFLLSFYEDESRPLGVNNALYPNVNMPHVLWYMEGVKQPIDGSMDDFKYISNGSMSVEEYEKSIQDLVNFLTYVSEPAKLERYKIGFWVILFLSFFAFVAYLLKIEYWKDIK